MDSVYLGIDIGGTNFRLGLVDEAYGIVHFEIQSTQKLLKSGAPLDNMRAAIQDYLDRELGGRTLKAISMGFPSTVDSERRVVRSTPNIAALQNLRVVDELEPHFPCPVFINRDVNFLLLYDLWNSRLPAEAMVAAVYYGTGLGNAIYVHGRLLTGKNGVAAELGHIPVLHYDEACPCGNSGCLELLASGKRLVSIKNEFFPDTDISDVFTRHGDTPQLHDYIDTLASAAAIEVNIFDPDYLILGGGITQMKDFPKHELEAAIVRHSRKPYPAENIEILYSDPAQENGVIGAAIYAARRLKERNFV